MKGFILGEKGQQEQIYNDKGERVPVTHIKTSSCYLIDVRYPEKHGYFSVILGFKQGKNIKKPILGKLKKAGVKIPLSFLREIRLDKLGSKIAAYQKDGKKGVEANNKQILIGNEIKASTIFSKGDLVQITGKSKGKGFAGVVKRHGFAGGPRTHGQSDRERAPGSIGQTTTPGRVYKGKRMAGRMGGEKITIKNLEILEVKDNELIVQGLAPGVVGGLLKIISA